MRKGDREAAAREGLRGGRRMELCREGDTIAGLGRVGIVGETCGRGVVLPDGGGRDVAAILVLGKWLDVEDEGRGWPLSSGAVQDSRRERGTGPGAFNTAGPLRGDAG